MDQSGGSIVAAAPLPEMPADGAAAGASSKLEERLSRASMRRQLRLRAVVERAAHRHAWVQARAAGARAKDSDMAAQLTECLQRAAAARDARLAAVAGRAAEAVARAREAAAEAKLRAEMEASQRRLLLLQRLERAERARQEALQAMSAARSHRIGPEGFLTRQATRRAQLRRQSSSRKLQAAWREFCEQQQTTQALAQAFAGTGVPFTVPLQEQVVGPQPQPAAAALPVAPSSDPTPAGTPDPCGSPTSTVRRHDGRLASAPTSIPQTPHTTPNRTPAHSLAGSPTRRAAGAATPLAGPATPAPLAMPPLRSIASVGEAPEPSGSSFERLAAAISSPSTLQAAQALLARLEARVNAKGVAAGSCAPLLRRLFPRAPPGSQPRYPARIFLCAYMVLAHPEVVFNTQGEREASLASAARSMLSAFEPLLARLAEPAVPPAGGAAAADADAGAGASGGATEADDEAAPAPAGPLTAILQLFDERWIMYLEQFVCWKSADAAGLEMELIRVAVELESSRLAKVAGGTSPSRLRSPEDLQAIANQVEHDLQLIGARVQKLGGAQGSARLAAALAAVRAAAAPERAAAGASDTAPQSPTNTAAALSRSPSQSPLKKAPRREYSTGAATDGAALSRSGSGASMASAGPAEHALDVAAALGQNQNLALIWHLLYDPQWQLSTADLEALWADALGDSDPLTDAPPALEEGDVAAVQLHVKRLAERAFWAALEERLVGSGEGEQRQALEQITTLLADLGAQLAETLPASEVEEVRLRLDRARLQETLPAADGRTLDLPALLGLLDWAGQAAARFGAPARDAAAAAGQAAVRRQLAAAGADPAAVAAAAVRGLRLVAMQLKLLRLDAANAHLRLLARQLGTEGAAAYAASKFEGLLGSPQACSPEQLVQRLPHTRAWLAAASGQLPHVEQMEAALLNGADDAMPAAQAQALPHMRAGLRASGSASGSSGPGSGAAAKLEPLSACQARSWRGLVRLGLVSLVSGEGTAMRLPTPETLCLDGARLHAAQGELQHLLVTATCLLLVRQSAGRALSPAEVEAAKRRLRAVLSDPAVRLPDIGAECARLAGGEPDAAREQAMHDSLQRMLSRGAGALKALTSGFSTALHALLLLGVDSSAAQAHAGLALRKCGAGELVEEARALAAELSRLAVVTEAVAAPWYQALSADLL